VSIPLDDEARAIEELVARGLYDPQAPDAEEQLRTIRRVFELGGTIDDLAAVEGNATALAVRLLLRQSPGRYTLGEAALRAGISIEAARRMNRACGFADAREHERVFDDADVEMLRGFEAARAFFGDQVMLQQVRAMGSAMARVADALVSGFAVVVATQTRGRELDFTALARANEAAIAMLPAAVRGMEVLLRRHLELRSRPAFVIGEGPEGVDVLERAVGFCDLVGYTALAENASPSELASILEAFEGEAADLITEKGANVVKLIGDEFMFVAIDAATMCDVALSLAEAFEAHPRLPSVRVGIATGAVIAREGDYFGPVVNLAARMVKLAPPRGVLAPASLAEQLTGRFSFEPAGAPLLKGFHEPVALVRVGRTRGSLPHDS